MTDYTTEVLAQAKQLLDKCIMLRRKFRQERTDEALEELRQAENERHRFYYKYNTQAEKKDRPDGTKNKIRLP